MALTLPQAVMIRPVALRVIRFPHETAVILHAAATAAFTAAGEGGLRPTLDAGRPVSPDGRHPLSAVGRAGRRPSSVRKTGKV